MGAPETMNDTDEALSLCDLPLDDSDRGDLHTQTRRSATDSAPEFFEFFSDDIGPEMCAADDIFLCGKLVPFNDPPVSSQSDRTQFNPTPPPLRKRSESLSDLPSRVKRNNSSLRGSRSLNYQKLRRSWGSPDLNIERNPSVRSIGKSDVSPKKAVKRRWYVFMFGMMKFPPEMELKDIKSRQFRRSPSVMFPSSEASKNFPGERSSGKCTWSLLKALSCRDHGSVAATAPLCVPQD